VAGHGRRPLTGHRWQRGLAVEELTGTQTFEFDKIHKVSGRGGRVRLTVEGTHQAPTEYKIDKIEATIDWSRLDRCILPAKGRRHVSGARDGWRIST
jgi:hypothetical protein